MKKNIVILFAAGMIALFYQNCAKISYADADGNINKSFVDGTLDGGAPGNTDGGEGDSVVQFPDAFQNRMSVAFEDLMTFSNRSSDTDMDYNDFVMSYNVREVSSGGFLKKIEITVTPQAREAGYEAQLILGLQGALSNIGSNKAQKAFLNSPEVKGVIEYYDQDDKLVSSLDIDVSKPIIVFRKTSEVFISQSANLEAGTSAHPIRVLCKEKARRKAKIIVTGLLSREENKARLKIETNRYPFYLYVESTQTLMGTTDIHPGHKTKDGYPMGLHVRGTYLHPAEAVNIKSVFPYFDLYVKALNGVSLSPQELTKAEAWSEWLMPDWSKKLACSPLN